MKFMFRIGSGVPEGSCRHWYENFVYLHGKHLQKPDV